MPRRYRFHGHAIGAGGRIEHPFHEFVDIQAATALPEIGGHGSAHSSNFRYRDILSFREAYTEVTGTTVSGPEDRHIHKLLVRARVDGLNIMGMVTADRVEVRLVAFTDDEDDEPCFKFTGTHFENLKIAGVPVKVHLAVDVFDRLHKHKHLVKSYKDKAEFRGLFEELTLKKKLKEAPPRVQQWFQQAPDKGGELPHVEGLTKLTLVRRLELDRPEFRCWGHVIYIEGFGTIHLAELGVSRHERHVTMIRVHLGSPVDGNLAVGTGCGGPLPY